MKKSKIRIFDKYHFHHFTVHRVICKHNEVDSVKYNGDWYKVLESYDDKGDYFYIICGKWDEWYCVHSDKWEDYSRKGYAWRQWSVAIPAWLCTAMVIAPGVEPEGLRCTNSFILTSEFQHPYPCSRETCPMLLEDDSLKGMAYYKKRWIEKQHAIGKIKIEQQRKEWKDNEKRNPRNKKVQTRS